MAEGKNATVKLVMEVMEEGDSAPMSVTTQVWNGLDRMGVLALEEIIVGSVIDATSDLGYTAEVAKGRVTPEQVAANRDAVSKARGKSGK